MIETTSRPRLYRLQNEPGYFYAGHLKDGTQVFLGIDLPKLIAVLFDQDGNYLTFLEKMLAPEVMAEWEQAVVENGAAWFVKDWDELDRWAAELGFTPGVIAVRKFSLPEFGLGIREIPEIYQKQLDSGILINTGEDLTEVIQFWKEANDYVLLWGDEIDISRDGKIVST